MKYFDEFYEFDSKDGFNIAAMFTAYDDNPDPILDPTYGEFLIRYTRWGENPDGTFYDEFDSLPSHTCTSEDLGLNEDGNLENSKFYKVRDDIRS